MRPNDQVQVVAAKELADDVSTEGKRDAAIVFSPALKI